MGTPTEEFQGPSEVIISAAYADDKIFTINFNIEDTTVEISVISPEINVTGKTGFALNPINLNTNVTVSDGSTPSFTATGLPPGLLLANGLLTGTPSADSSTRVTVTVSAGSAEDVTFDLVFDITTPVVYFNVTGSNNSLINGNYYLDSGDFGHSNAIYSNNNYYILLNNNSNHWIINNSSNNIGNILTEDTSDLNSEAVAGMRYIPSKGLYKNDNNTVNATLNYAEYINSPWEINPVYEVTGNSITSGIYCLIDGLEHVSKYVYYSQDANSGNGVYLVYYDHPGNLCWTFHKFIAAMYTPDYPINYAFDYTNQNNTDPDDPEAYKKPYEGTYDKGSIVQKITN